MGSSASNIKEGAPANPRLLYSESLSQKNNKPMLLDAPVLIDVEHGSIRYRYSPYSNEPSDKRKRVERPYEGDTVVHKQNYFYHARVSQDENANESFKRLYVTKAPVSSKQKSIYYVYGQGFNGQDGQKINPLDNKLESRDYSWPVNLNHKDLHYKLSFVHQDEEITDVNEEDLLILELESTPDKSSIVLQVSDSDTAGKLKSVLAGKLLKAATNIHLYHNNRDLRNEDVVGDLRDSQQQLYKVFKVQLSRN